MKKVLALILAAIMVLGVASAFADKTPLTLWSIAVEGDSNRAAYLAAVDAFNAENPDYELTMEPTENEAYKTKIKAAMSSGEELPDIFFTWSMSFLGDFVEAGRVYCLDDELVNWKDELTDTVLANSTYDGKHYGVPLTMNVVTMFANMDLLAEAGWDHVPETYDELIELCKALKEKDIVAFGVAGKENWCLSEYTEPLLAKTIGSQGLADCYTGAASWDQEGVITAMEKFIELKEYFDPNAAALGNEEVKQNFIAGKYAFYQNGSWNCGEVNDAEGNFQVALFPVIDADKATYGQVIGGPSDSLAVAATAEDPAFVADIAFALGKAICHYGYLAGSGLPAWTPDYDTSAVKPLVAAVADIVANSEGMVLFGDTAMSAEPAQTYLSFVSQVYGCEIDGAGFIQGLTAALQ